jgi:hypothetical protein
MTFEAYNVRIQRVEPGSSGGLQLLSHVAVFCIDSKKCHADQAVMQSYHVLNPRDAVTTECKVWLFLVRGLQTAGRMPPADVFYAARVYFYIVSPYIVKEVPPKSIVFNFKRIINKNK